MVPGDFAAYVVIGVAGISFLTLVSAVARRIAGPRGRMAERLGAAPGLVIGAHMGGAAAQRTLEELKEEVESLRAEVSDLHGRLTELDDLHNRLDFAERMLAQVKERGALPRGQ